MPVSRQWDAVKGPHNLDWGYVIFDWDNIFATYMTSLSSKDIAYSNFIQVIRSKTAMGFVPNFSAGGSKSLDRTEPPIGAKVLLEMHNKFKDVWIVELLFDDLLAWNDWFVAERMFGPFSFSVLKYPALRDLARCLARSCLGSCKVPCKVFFCKALQGLAKLPRSCKVPC